MDGKSDSWEVVSGKKAAKGSEPLTKAKKKALREKMPTIQPSAPVEESTTIYEAFIKNEERKERKALQQLQQQQQSAGSSQAAATSAAGKKSTPVAKKDKDKAPEKKKEKPISLDEAVKKIDIKKFEQVLERTKSSFPNNPDLWLKDLASVLNIELSNISADNDPVFSNKPWGYPLTKLQGRVSSIMLDTLKKASSEVIAEFVLHCVEGLLDEQSKQCPTIGYRMFIQLVLTNQPLAVVNHPNTYLELLKQNVNRPLRALSILWSVGQAGLSSLPCGLRVWLDIMLPVMNLRNLSNYCMLYLENLLEVHKKSLAAGGNSLPKKDFFMLFDQLFSDQSSLTTELRSRMKTVYPKLKAVAWGDESNATLHNLFSSFLTRCTADCPTQKKSELLNCLVDCLVADPQSFAIWRQTYTKHLEQSSILLRHLSDNFERVSSDMNGKILFETVRSFHRTNEELAEDPVSKSPHYARCVSACEELLVKMSAPKFAWNKLLFFVLVLLVSAVFYDVYLHGGVRKSRTYRTLEEYGVLAFLHHLWQRFLIYCSIVYKWLQVNVPFYYSKISEIVGPYVSLVWEKICSGVALVVATLHPLCVSVKEQIPTVIQYLEEKLPLLLEYIVLYIGIVVTVLTSTAVWFYHVVSHYTLIVWQWLQTNVLTGDFTVENIYAAVSAGLLSVQAYIQRFYLWCSTLVSS